MNNLGNYITYKVRTSRINLKNPVEIDSNQYSLVNKITLTTIKKQSMDNSRYNERNLVIRFDLEDEILDYKEAALVVNNPLEDILNGIVALNSRGYMSLPVLQEVKIKFQCLRNSGIVSSVDVVSGDNILNELKNNIKNIHTTPYDTLYRMALSNEDEVARFMFLYSILAIIKGPAQNLIDTYIKSNEPSVEMIQTTRPEKTYLETAYTHYRNRVGHTDSSSDLKEVREKIDLLLGGLNKLVIQAINGFVTP